MCIEVHIFKNKSYFTDTFSGGRNFPNNASGGRQFRRPQGNRPHRRFPNRPNFQQQRLPDSSTIGAPL